MYLNDSEIIKKHSRDLRRIVTHLESCPLMSKLLVVQHGLQDLLVSSRHETHRAEELQGGDLGPQVAVGAQALGDDVDARGVGKDVGATGLKGESGLDR